MDPFHNNFHCITNESEKNFKCLFPASLPVGAYYVQNLAIFSTDMSIKFNTLTSLL